MTRMAIGLHRGRHDGDLGLSVRQHRGGGREEQVRVRPMPGRPMPETRNPKPEILNHAGSSQTV